MNGHSTPLLPAWSLMHGFCLKAACLLAAGCWSGSEREVVVYTALDREFSRSIFDDFESQSDTEVAPKFDVESTKTVGLVNEIIQQRARPRCDVFWNNEILHTLRLERLGQLESFDLPQAEKFPAQYRSPKGRWYGFAARARVLIVNTEMLAGEELPTSIHDLADSKWKGRCGIARPLFGTTATHAAVLFSHWGEQEARKFFLAVKQNAAVVSGNKQVALDVAAGKLAFGLTDTDDAIVEIERGMPVAIVYPDQDADEMGTLRIPNTLCIIKGGPNPERARELLKFLLTAETETRLARGPSAQFPLHADVVVMPRVARKGTKWMEVDFAAAAKNWERAAKFIANQL